MKNLIRYEKFHISERLDEKKGIHHAIRGILVDFMKENPDATYKEASSHVAQHVQGWKLSKDDFNEAKDL